VPIVKRAPLVVVVVRAITVLAACDSKTARTTLHRRTAKPTRYSTRSIRSYLPADKPPAELIGDITGSWEARAESVTQSSLNMDPGAGSRTHGIGYGSCRCHRRLSCPSW
jgi:hypothetical protein